MDLKEHGKIRGSKGSENLINKTHILVLVLRINAYCTKRRKLGVDIEKRGYVKAWGRVSNGK